VGTNQGLLKSGLVRGFGGRPLGTIENADAQIYSQNPVERFSVKTSSFSLTDVCNDIHVYFFSYILYHQGWFLVGGPNLISGRLLKMQMLKFTSRIQVSDFLSELQAF
jgi:hypothetical protein